MVGDACKLMGLFGGENTPLYTQLDMIYYLKQTHIGHCKMFTDKHHVAENGSRAAGDGAGTGGV